MEPIKCREGKAIKGYIQRATIVALFLLCFSLSGCLFAAQKVFILQNASHQVIHLQPGDKIDRKDKDDFILNEGMALLFEGYLEKLLTAEEDSIINVDP